MSSVEFKNFIERVKTCLRKKRDKKEEAICTLNEIYATFSQDEKKAKHYYKLASFLESFNEAIKDNPKIRFDIENSTFSFKKKFQSIDDLVHRLYTERIGVREDQDLYDDVDKESIDALKRQDLLREIVIKERKTRAPIVLIYSKNYEGDEVEKLKLEEKSPKLLKEYWASIEQEETERKKYDKKSGVAFLVKNHGAKKKKEKRRNRRYRQEDNLWLWENKHLMKKIEKGLKAIENRKGTVKKKLKTR